MARCPAFVLALALATPAVAEDLPLRLTLVDVPQALDLPHVAPTWEQALNLTGAVTTGAHLGLHHAFAGVADRWWGVTLEMSAIALFDFLLVANELPLTLGWMHEEGHRAAMGVYGVPSLQAFNNLFYGASEKCDPGSVCGMTDAQIARLVESNAPAWVRVQAAGMETELELVRRTEQLAFFHDAPARVNVPLYWLAFASVEGYRHVCATSDGFIEADVTGESAHVQQRDFTGPDCTGWVWDLFRPHAGYAARGTHPNGDGVRRVRLASDLTATERDWLVQVRNLGFLNLLDPNLFGLPRFETTLASGRKLAFNVSVQHDLTAFGDAFGLQALVKTGALNVRGLARAYRSEHLVLPGLAATLYRYPLELSGFAFTGTATAELWLQPEGLAFASEDVAIGGALELSAAVPVGGPFSVFATLRAKSAGWQPVEPYLAAAVSFRLGLDVLVPAG